MEDINILLLIVVYISLYVFYLSSTSPIPTPESLLSPIILIPGDGGCQAYGLLNNVVSKPFLIWINFYYFLTPKIFAKYFTLKYDPIERTTTDNDNVTVYFPGWGETWSVENLDNSPHYATLYFGDLITKLKKNPYYISNQTIRGAPFDFRKAPNELEDLNLRLKQLIEETYRNASERKVVILGHSYGALISLRFFKLQSDAWKKKYIKAFISVSGPFGGSLKALKIAVSGDNFGLSFEQSVWYRSVLRSMPSLFFLLPNSRLWSKSDIIIQTPDKNYTVYDYEQLLKDINYTVGWEMLKDSRGLVDYFVGPTGIKEVYCVHGSGLKTASRLVYSPPSFFRQAFPDQNPDLLYEDGDGTVNLRSLEPCRNWSGVNYTVFEGLEHVHILRETRLLDYIQHILRSDPK